MPLNDFDLVQEMLSTAIKYVVFEKDGIKRLSSLEEWEEYFEKYGFVAAMRDFSNVVETGLELEETEY